MDLPDAFIPTRQSLLSRLRNWRDADSWQDFFNTYWKLIYSVALRSGLNESEAQEVVQETVVSVAKKMPDFRYQPAIGSFKGWLLQITRRRIVDQFRKRDRAAHMSRSEDETSQTAILEQLPDPGEFEVGALWEEEWQKNLMNAAVENVKGQVNSQHYQIFDLCIIKRWPVKDVTRTLRVNAAQVYLVKHRVVALIKKEIKRLEKKMSRPLDK